MTLTGSRRLAVALSSTALMGLSALAVPGAAGAAEVDCDPADVTYSVTGGSIKWGVKESFRSYLAGPIAHGGWNLTGTTFEGSERGADGQFVWPIAEGAGTVGADGSASASGTGSVRMHGHSEVLDTTLSNPTVVINGTDGEIKVDYKAKKPEAFTPTAPFVWVEGTQATGATFSLDAAQDFQQSGTVTVTTTDTLLTDELDAAMANFYGAGAEIDNVTLILDITETCNAEPGDGNPGDGEPGEGEPGDGEPGDGTIPGDNNNGGGIFGSLGTILGFIGS